MGVIVIINKTIGDRLKILRKEKKLSQREVSELCFVSRSTYSQYETGVINPPLSVQIALANYYGVSLDYLNNVTDDPGTNKKPLTEDIYYANIPLISLDDYRVIRYIKTPNEKVSKGTFCYVTAPYPYEVERISKNDLILLNQTASVLNGDTILLKSNDLFLIGSIYISEHSQILFNPKLPNKFKEIDPTDSILGVIKEILIRL